MTSEILAEINYLAVLVVAVVGMAIGALWYGPVFGKLWISLMGWTDEQVARMKEQGMSKSYFVNFVSLLVLTCVLSFFVSMAGVETFGGGAAIGFWAWLGFVATIMLGSVLWEGRRAKLYLLNISHWLVVLILMGGILAIWR